MDSRDARDSHSAPVKPEFLYSPEEAAKLRHGSRQAFVAGGAEDDDEAEVQEPKAEATAAPRKSGFQARTGVAPGSKKRGRDGEGPAMCRDFMLGKTCNFGDRCKYSHDIAGLLAAKLPDIGPECRMYRLTGYCIQGYACRFGNDHIDPETKKLTFKPESERTPLPQSVNAMSHDTANALRRRKYVFKVAPAALAKLKKASGSKDDEAVDVPVPAGGAGCASGECGTADTATADNPAPDEAAAGDTDDIGERSAKHAKVVPSEESAVPAAVESKPEVVPTVQVEATGRDVQRVHARERKTVDFKGKVYIAPLTTVGNLPYRRIMKRFGADITCGEMALTQNILEGSASEWALLRRHPSEDVFGIQIAGCFPDQISRVSELIEEHVSADFVDINCGCPIDALNNKGMGAALMGRTSRLRDLLTVMTDILSIPVTVKMRTGLEDKHPIAAKMVYNIRQWNMAAAVTVHGRSRQQRYTRKADWDYITQCADVAHRDYGDGIPPIPIIGNGDVFNFHDWNKHLETHKVDTCLIARGALVKPWLPTEIKKQEHWDISSGERFDMLKDFVNYGLEHWGSDDRGVDNTRRYLLEWLSFLHRYIPVGLLEVLPQGLNDRPPLYFGRNDLETLMASPSVADWIKLSEMLLGPVPEGFTFEPKHRSNSYSTEG